MKLKLTLLLFFFFLLNAKAQKEGNNWTFGDSAGVNFNNISNPAVFTSSESMVNGWAPSLGSSLSDSSGNLFSYISGINTGWHSLWVFDKTHHKMPNGDSLYGNSIYASLLLTQPGSDSLISLYYFGRDSVNTNYWWLFYSRINKNLNGGLGDITLRDSAVYYGQIAGLKLTAVRHANGRDWWILLLDRVNGFVSFLSTPSGISQQSIQYIGSDPSLLYYGVLVFSNDGSKLMDVGTEGQIDVFDFDRCSGQLSNFRDIGEHLTSHQYQYDAAAFSPNGNVIYVSPQWYTDKYFYQFDLTATNITASKLTLNFYPDTGIVQYLAYYSHVLAPDGKIYIVLANGYGLNSQTNITAHLDVIENPDVVGLGCNYTRQAFYLGGHHSTTFLPNMPYYGLGALIGSPCDTVLTSSPTLLLEEKGVLSLYPNPAYSNCSITFSYPSKGGEREIVINDINGREVARYALPQWSSVQHLKLPQLSSGIYIARLTGGEAAANVKFVVE